MQLKQFWRLSLIGTTFVCLLLGTIPLRLAIAYAQAPQPEAIFVLGGNPARENAAAQLARYYPNLEVWTSSGELPQQAQAIFGAAGVAPRRLHLDYRATDTVTNFTTLVHDLQQHDIQHVYLVTSGFHMRRARVIATLVLGSSGIAFTPVAAPPYQPEESWWRVARDAGRSLLWIATGRTGSSLGERISRQGAVEQERGLLGQKAAKLAAKLRDLGVIDPETGKP